MIHLIVPLTRVIELHAGVWQRLAGTTLDVSYLTRLLLHFGFNGAELDDVRQLSVEDLIQGVLEISVIEIGSDSSIRMLGDADFQAALMDLWRELLNYHTIIFSTPGILPKGKFMSGVFFVRWQGKDAVIAIEVSGSDPRATYNPKWQVPA